MDGGNGAVRCESVYVKKRRYRLAQEHVFKKACIAYYCLADSGFGSVFGLVLKLVL